MKLATQVGAEYNAATVARDVRTLWSIGRFRDVTVETLDSGAGEDVIFHVTLEPQYPLGELRYRPHAFGLQISLPPGTLITAPRANDLAHLAQRQLNERGYARARVTASLAPAAGGKADVILDVAPGEALRLKALGDLTLKAPRWYSEAAVASHVARLQSQWVTRGYFDARVTASGRLEAKRALVNFHVEPGPYYRRFDTTILCSCLFAERRAREREGELDFEATVDESGAWRIQPGRQYTVGRIWFTGHPHYSDAAVRGQFLLDEGVPLDSWLLRQSVVRLNRAGMFEPLDEKQVHVQTDERTGVANVVVNLTERKRGAWNLSGPLPLMGSIGARLPSWGAGVLELATYTASFHVLAYSTILKLAANRRFAPVLMLERPFTPGGGWLSGVSFAPQLGPKWMAASYVSTQLEQRLGPALAGVRVPDLTVTMARPGGETAILCEAPRPKWRALRMAGGIGLGLLRTLAN